MKAEGNAGTYVAGTEGVPIPKFGDQRLLPPAPASPKPRGLDWSQHRAPDAAPDGDETRERFTLCAVCGRKMPKERRRSVCDACEEDVEARFHADVRPATQRRRGSLEKDLAELEQTDPVVKEAAGRLDDVIQRVTRPEDHLKAPDAADTPPTAPPSTPAGVVVQRPGKHAADGPRFQCTAARRTTCPVCGSHLMGVGLPDLLYTFEICTCREQSTYDHLVEQLWHRTCFVRRAGGDLEPVEVVTEQGDPVPSTAPPSAAVIRAWAQANGYPVTTHGRMSREVHDAYERAHQGDA